MPTRNLPFRHAQRQGSRCNESENRCVTLAYTVQAVPEEAVAQQRASFTALLQNLGSRR